MVDCVLYDEWLGNEVYHNLWKVVTWHYLTWLPCCRPDGAILKLVGTCKYLYKEIKCPKKGQNYFNAHVFQKKIVWSKPDFLQNLVGTNPNRPHIFHWACAVVVNYGYDAKNRTRNQQWVTPWGLSPLVVTFNASTHCWFPKLLQLHFLCAS